MRKIYSKAAYGLGQDKPKKILSNHFASSMAYPREVQEQITTWGLTRVAGNAFICESSKDFWTVKDGHIKKLVGNEVDNHEQLQAAPEDHPEQFLEKILEDLEF